MLVALFTKVRIVALEHLALDVHLERLDNVGTARNVEADRVEGLLALRAVLARLAHELRAQRAAPDALQQPLLRRALERLLDLVDEAVEELVDVLLQAHVDRVLVVVFDGVAQRARMVALLLTLLQVAEHHLQLVQQVVGARLVVGEERLLAHAEDAVAEALHHEQLLQQRDHVADAAEVADADVAGARALFEPRRVAPVKVVLGRLDVHLVYQLQELALVVHALLAQQPQQLEADASRRRVLALGRTGLRALILGRHAEQALVEHVPNHAAVALAADVLAAGGKQARHGAQQPQKALQNEIRRRASILLIVSQYCELLVIIIVVVVVVIIVGACMLHWSIGTVALEDRMCLDERRELIDKVHDIEADGLLDGVIAGTDLVQVRCHQSVECAKVLGTQRRRRLDLGQKSNQNWNEGRARVNGVARKLGAAQALDGAARLAANCALERTQQCVAQQRLEALEGHHGEQQLIARTHARHQERRRMLDHDAVELTRVRDGLLGRVPHDAQQSPYQSRVIQPINVLS